MVLLDFLLLFLSQTIYYIEIGLWVLTTCFATKCIWGLYGGNENEGNGNRNDH